MNTDIAPIETHYKGCRFRSRLEARWAVALDHRGLGWQYEPEGFETPCGRYLPDFRVVLFPPGPGVIGMDCWLEVKPSDYQLDQNDLGRWISVSRGTGLMLLVACGMDTRTISITPDHTYTHASYPGIIGQSDVVAGMSARFEFGEQG
jgi:hypothetical protein